MADYAVEIAGEEIVAAGAAWASSHLRTSGPHTYTWLVPPLYAFAQAPDLAQSPWLFPAAASSGGGGGTTPVVAKTTGQLWPPRRR